jgi:hypothetical protein
MKFIFFLYLTLFCFGCSEQAEEQTIPLKEETRVESFERRSNYENGTFCAQIEYFNPRTGTHSTYTLTIEVEEGRLVKIYWPNGGWLDESHYSGVEISDSGEANFETDNGYQYTLQIIESDSCNFDSDIESDDQNSENSDEDLGEDENEEEEDPDSYN